MIHDRIPDPWIQGDRQERPTPLTLDEREADARYQLAIVLLDQGKRQEAIDQLKRAFRTDPNNLLIQKQLWAIETPQAFYDGEVDYDWQKTQIQKEEKEIGNETEQVWVGVMEACSRIAKPVNDKG